MKRNSKVADVHAFMINHVELRKREIRAKIAKAEAELQSAQAMKEAYLIQTRQLKEEGER